MVCVCVCVCVCVSVHVFASDLLALHNRACLSSPLFFLPLSFFCLVSCMPALHVEIMYRRPAKVGRKAVDLKLHTKKLKFDNVAAVCPFLCVCERGFLLE